MPRLGRHRPTSSSSRVQAFDIPSHSTRRFLSASRLLGYPPSFTPSLRRQLTIWTAAVNTTLDGIGEPGYVHAIDMADTLAECPAGRTRAVYPDPGA